MVKAAVEGFARRWLPQPQLRMRRRASLAALVAAACARGVARGGAAVERTPEAICASLRRPANATRARAPFHLVGVESFSQQAEDVVVIAAAFSDSNGVAVGGKGRVTSVHALVRLHRGPVQD